MSLPLLFGKTGPIVLGRNWLQTDLRLNWHHLYKIKINESMKIMISDLLEEYTPLHTIIRPVPFAFRDKVTAELQRLEDTGVLERMKHSDWAAPIVPTVKSDGKGIRIYGDFRSTLNPVSEVYTYPIPRVDLYSRLSEICTFTKIDLSNAYLQIPENILQ